MKVDFKDIQEAFEFVSFGEMYTHQAFLDKGTGKVYWYSEFDDDEEELPEDIDDEKYIAIPHKTELDLGKRLAFEFAFEYLPQEVENIEAIFRKKGAYSRFKAFLEERNLLEIWYEYESLAQEKGLRAWCEENDIKIHD